MEKVAHDDIHGQPAPLVFPRDLQQLFTSLEQTAAGMTRTLANIEQLTAHDADLAWQLSGSLTEVGKAAAAVRRLADYLEQNPNALLFGQGKEEP